MNRLTHERCSGIKTGYWTTAKKEELIQRLAAFENTGLEPEQIEVMKGHNTALIEQLTEKESPWISVKDKLPENKQWVLCLCQANIFDVLRFDYPDWSWERSGGKDRYFKSFVTHWMPLPEPPTKEG